MKTQFATLPIALGARGAERHRREPHLAAVSLLTNAGESHFFFFPRGFLSMEIYRAVQLLRFQWLALMFGLESKPPLASVGLSVVDPDGPCQM